MGEKISEEPPPVPAASTLGLCHTITLLHSKRPKLFGSLAVLGAMWLGNCKARVMLEATQLRQTVKARPGPIQQFSFLAPSVLIWICFPLVDDKSVSRLCCLFT